MPRPSWVTGASVGVALVTVIALLLWSGDADVFVPARRTPSRAPARPSPRAVEPATPPLREPTDERREPAASRPAAPGTLLSITVRDASDGQPIADATVTVLMHDEFDRLAASPTRRTTDARGLAIVVAPDDPLLRSMIGELCVLAEHDGYAPAVGFTFFDDAIVIDLVRATEIHGRVLDYETRAPIAGARVVMGDRPEWQPGGAFEVVTDAGGTYRLDRAARSELLDLHVFRDGVDDVHVRVATADSTSNEFDILLPPVVLHRFRVVDARDGSPIQGARLWSSATIVTSDADGCVATSTPRRAERWFALSKAGFCTTTVQQASARDSQDDRVVPMVRGCVVDGIVLDADGAPVAGASVRQEPFDAREADPLVETLRAFDTSRLFISAESVRGEVKTGADGRFTGVRVKPGPRPIRIEVIDDDHGWLRSEPIVLATPGDHVDATLRYPQRGAIHGSVVPAGGQWELHWRGDSMAGGAETDRDGTFRIASAEAGRVTVELISTGDRFALASADVVVPIGGVARCDLVVDESIRGITGRAVRLDGSPARVALVFRGAVDVDWETEDDGRFAVSCGAPDGTEVEIVAMPQDGLRPQSAVAHVGDTDVVLVVPAAGAARLSIVDASSGEPLPHAEVGWTIAAGESSVSSEFANTWWPAGADKAMRCVLPIGRPTLTIDATDLGYAVQSAEVDVRSDADPTDESARRTQTIRLNKRG